MNAIVRRLQEANWSRFLAALGGLPSTATNIVGCDRLLRGVWCNHVGVACARLYHLEVYTETSHLLRGAATLRYPGFGVFLLYTRPGPPVRSPITMHDLRKRITATRRSFNEARLDFLLLHEDVSWIACGRSLTLVATTPLTAARLRDAYADHLLPVPQTLEGVAP